MERMVRDPRVQAAEFKHHGSALCQAFSGISDNFWNGGGGAERGSHNRRQLVAATNHIRIPISGWRALRPNPWTLILCRTDEGSPTVPRVSQGTSALPPTPAA